MSGLARRYVAEEKLDTLCRNLPFHSTGLVTHLARIWICLIAGYALSSFKLSIARDKSVEKRGLGRGAIPEREQLCGLGRLWRRLLQLKSVGTSAMFRNTAIAVSADISQRQTFVALTSRASFVQDKVIQASPAVETAIYVNLAELCYRALLRRQRGP